jgi:hypothetical protein
VGLLLLGTAGLKLYGLNVQPVAQHGLLLDPSIQVALVEWELVLGLWLITGRGHLAAWFAAILTFIAFGLFSFRLGLAGVASCGCFGSIEASPWHAFAADLAVLALLLVVHPEFRSYPRDFRILLKSLVLPGVALTASAGVIYAGLLAVAILTFGSTSAALAALRGQPVSLKPSPLDLGQASPNQVLEAVVEVVNYSDHPVRIIGGTSDCSCVATDDLPMTLAVNEARPISIRVRLSSETGFFNRKVIFWTDNDLARLIGLTLTGRVKPLE